MEESKSYFQGK